MFKKSEKTWNSCRVPRLVDVEDSPLRVPYIEDEIWGSSPRRQLPVMAETAPFDISIAPLNFASLSSPSSLANSCTFLVSIWRIIKDLARSALTTVPGQRRRVLFLVRLKNKRILSLCFLCLSCNAHDSGNIFCSRKVKKLGTPAGFQG